MPDTVVGIASSRASRACAELHHLYRRLAVLRSLAPSPEVDTLFRRLVTLVLTMEPDDADEVLADPSVRTIRADLHRICATGEAELERSWAQRVAASSCPAAELERFPYAGNYRLLTELEWSVVRGGAPHPPRTVAFVGAGPLPLTALLLARDHGVSAVALDRCRAAVQQARGVIDALGFGDRVLVRRADALRCPDLRRYDVVVLAALVGSTPACKRAVIARLGRRMRPGALLAARSANAARSLLYPPLDLGALGGLELLRVVHPHDQVVNSVVLARKPVEKGAQSWPDC